MEEMPPEFREWPIEFGAAGYVAFYRFDGNDVIILSVRHGKEADR
jgi:plasmid stabilization system protein ParE